MTRKDNSIQSPSGGAPSLTIDWELYGQMLDASDWDEDQKREFITCLWSIVVAFVDLGFDIHPVQQVIDDELACGQNKDQGAFPNVELVDSRREETAPCP